MNFDGKQMQDEFNKAFNGLNGSLLKPIEYLTVEQLWWLVKFAKHIRMKCRNNSAFNNYMNRNFPNAQFMEITKVNRKGESYQGLSIIVNGMEVQENDSND